MDKLLDIPEQKPLPTRILNMLALYGGSGQNHCGTCRWLCRVKYHDYSYYKCGYTTWSHGPRTDWRTGWAACGLYVTGGPTNIHGPEQFDRLWAAAEEHKESFHR